MGRFPALLVLLVAGVSFVGPAAAPAGTVRAMSLEEMTDGADQIFVGRVVGTRTEWSADRTRIYTYVTFEVDRFLKGGGDARTATIRLLGGRVGPYLSIVPGSPRFGGGEEVLLFSVGTAPSVPTVLGLSLGKFTLTKDASGETFVKRDISTLMLANHRTDSRRPGDPVTRYALADIEGQIRGFLR